MGSQPMNLLTRMCFSRNVDKAGDSKALLRALKTMNSLRSLKMARGKGGKEKRGLGYGGRQHHTGACTQRRPCEHSEKAAICKPRREASRETKPVNTCVLGF